MGFSNEYRVVATTVTQTMECKGKGEIIIPPLHIKRNTVILKWSRNIAFSAIVIVKLLTIDSSAFLVMIMDTSSGSAVIRFRCLCCYDIFCYECRCMAVGDNPCQDSSSQGLPSVMTMLEVNAPLHFPCLFYQKFSWFSSRRGLGRTCLCRKWLVFPSRHRLLIYDHKTVQIAAVITSRHLKLNVQSCILHKNL